MLKITLCSEDTTRVVVVCDDAGYAWGNLYQETGVARDAQKVLAALLWEEGKPRSIDSLQQELFSPEKKLTMHAPSARRRPAPSRTSMAISFLRNILEPGDKPLEQIWEATQMEAGQVLLRLYKPGNRFDIALEIAPGVLMPPLPLTEFQVRFSEPLLIPRVLESFDAYRVVKSEPVREGAFGVVYKVFNPSDLYETPMALKVLKKE